jgi:hypothetical protein
MYAEFNAVQIAAITSGFANNTTLCDRHSWRSMPTLSSLSLGLDQSRGCFAVKCLMVRTVVLGAHTSRLVAMTVAFLCLHCG